MSKLNIAIIQTSIVWEDIEKNLAMLGEKIVHLSEQVDIVVLPEMFTTGFSMSTQLVGIEMVRQILDWMEELAQSKNILLVGSMIFTEDGETYTNRLIAMFPDRHYEWYDKVQLFNMGGEGEVFQAGHEIKNIMYKGWRIRPLVCYDLRYSELSDHSGDIDILLYVASWPSRRIRHWDALLKARAIENLSYVVAVNRVGVDGGGVEYPGHSQILDPMGDEVGKWIDLEVEAVVSIDMQMVRTVREKLPFLEDKKHMGIKKPSHS
jgi:omega-amidase